MAHAVTPAPNLSAFAALTVADAEGHRHTIHFGATLPGDVERARFTLPPVPPAGAFDARLDGDTRLTEEAEALVHVQASAFPVRLEADALPAGEYEFDVLVDGEVVATHELAAGAPVEIAVPEALLQAGFTLHVRPVTAAELPAAFALLGAYPNPFRQEAAIAFDLPETADLRLEVFDLLGRRVAVIEETDVEAGASRALRLRADGLASGAYVFRLEAAMPSGKEVATGRLTLIR